MIRDQARLRPKAPKGSLASLIVKTKKEVFFIQSWSFIEHHDLLFLFFILYTFLILIV